MKVTHTHRHTEHDRTDTSCFYCFIIIITHQTSSLITDHHYTSSQTSHDLHHYKTHRHRDCQTQTLQRHRRRHSFLLHLCRCHNCCCLGVVDQVLRSRTSVRLLHHHHHHHHHYHHHHCVIMVEETKKNFYKKFLYERFSC